MNRPGRMVLSFAIGCTMQKAVVARIMADSNAVGLRIASYNLYGLKSGRTMLYDLCNDARVAVVAVQEHWLTPNNLNLLNEVNPDFAGFGIIYLL